ncbi:MAG: glycosyl hydrolase [Thermogutta sp.]
MKRTFWICACGWVIGLATASAVAALSDGELRSSEQVLAILEQPPREFSTAPLWVWNDMLRDEQIVSTLEDLASQGVKQVFVHPRPGLMTPYLSPEWFRLWRLALDAAERLDMNVWIYDENSYPSGFAGGWVPEEMPESRGRGLKWIETDDAAKVPPEAVTVHRLFEDRFEDFTADFKAGTPLPAGRYLATVLERAVTAPWYGNRFYVDLLYPGVTQKFLKLTLDAYQREIGDQFGRRVPGSFTDEPHLQVAGDLTWTDDLAAEFQRRMGYGLLPHLPSLRHPLGNWRKVRHDYYRLLLELFIERWAQPYSQWCEDHGLEFTGHYWEHDWPNCSAVPDNMAMYAWHQRPAIDCLMNQYAEHTHAQFGNIRAVRELSSAADQLGRRRTLCELYGAGGWDLRFEDMKRIADWLGVLGVNTFDQHLSYITIRGARKMDHPQSFSYHASWWKDYHVIARYLTRLSLVLSAGERRNDILLLEPTSTAWLYQGDAATADELRRLGDQFFNLVKTLEYDQVEYDLGCEDIMRRHGAVEKGALRIGHRSYHTVVIPPLCQNLESATVDLLKAFLEEGGTVICCGEVPRLVDGAEAPAVTELATMPGWVSTPPSELSARLLKRQDAAVRITWQEPRQGILLHQRRRLSDGEMVLLVNTSLTQSAVGTVDSAYPGVQRWDLEKGAAEAYPFQRKASGSECEFTLLPAGSLVLFFSGREVPSSERPLWTESPVALDAGIEVRRLQPNVLTLDYMDVAIGETTRSGLYFFEACDWVFKQHGLPGNPWDRAVQFRDELITRTFPADSGFTLGYRFTIRGSVPSPLWIVVERGDLYRIACNGQPLTVGDDWWLDRAFHRIEISKAAKVGENLVTLTASPLTMWHEPASAYLLGDFSLIPAAKGFEVVPPETMRFNDAGRLEHVTEPNGTMWLSSGVGFRSNSKNDYAPWLLFDLGRPTNLRSVKIWNYNEANLTQRGVKDFELIAMDRADPDAEGRSLGRFTLAQAAGGKTSPAEQPPVSQTLAVAADGVRFLKLAIRSNHAGVIYPATPQAPDNAFVGLSEVRFYEAADGAEREVDGVSIAAASSELAEGFQRLAVHLVDGSGLHLGWNSQGCPFYADEMSYAARVVVHNLGGDDYYVRLRRWNGAVAKVFVNGQPAGHIYRQPWECRITPTLKIGENFIEVVVTGTPKNLLGPHHAGVMRGSAWPHAFAQGPKEGPPPGSAYDTIPYGLFESFEVLRRTPAN